MQQTDDDRHNDFILIQSGFAKLIPRRYITTTKRRGSLYTCVVVMDYFGWYGIQTAASTEPVGGGEH